MLSQGTRGFGAGEHLWGNLPAVDVMNWNNCEGKSPNNSNNNNDLPIVSISCLLLYIICRLDGPVEFVFSC